jgi:transcription antitermination factor NusG
MNLEELRSVSSIYGVQGLVVAGNGCPLPITDDFVQNVIHQSRGAADSWSKGIKRGSFVRIIYGDTHMLCGHVKKIVAGVADVEVELRLRTVRVVVPVRALLNLDHVKEAEREYFYADCL